VCMINGSDLNKKIQCFNVDLKSGYKPGNGISEHVYDIVKGLDDRSVFARLLEMNGLSRELSDLNGSVYTLFVPSNEALYQLAGGSTPSEAARNISKWVESKGVRVRDWLLNYVSSFNFRQDHLRSLIDQPPVLQTLGNASYAVGQIPQEDAITVGSSRINGSSKARNGTVYLVDELLNSDD